MILRVASPPGSPLGPLESIKRDFGQSDRHLWLSCLLGSQMSWGQATAFDPFPKPADPLWCLPSPPAHSPWALLTILLLRSTGLVWKLLLFYIQKNGWIEAIFSPLFKLWHFCLATAPPEKVCRWDTADRAPVHHLSAVSGPRNNTFKLMFAYISFATAQLNKNYLFKEGKTLSQYGK